MYSNRIYSSSKSTSTNLNKVRCLLHMCASYRRIWTRNTDDVCFKLSWLLSVILDRQNWFLMTEVWVRTDVYGLKSGFKGLGWKKRGVRAGFCELRTKGQTTEVFEMTRESWGLRVRVWGWSLRSEGWGQGSEDWSLMIGVSGLESVGWGLRVEIWRLRTRTRRMEVWGLAI